MTSKGANIVDIINGISQAYANYYDGVHDENFAYDRTRKIGLKKEEEYKITDRMIIDGFGIIFSGNKIRISYSCPLSVNEIYDTNLEKRVDEAINNIVSYLKKEFKMIKKKSLGLKQEGELQARTEKVSNVRYQVIGTKWYSINGIEEETSEYKINKALGRFFGNE